MVCVSYSFDHLLAGIVSGKSLFNNNEASIQRIMDVNTTSHFWTIREFVPAMLERWILIDAVANR